MEEANLDGVEVRVIINCCQVPPPWSTCLQQLAPAPVLMLQLPRHLRSQTHNPKLTPAYGQNPQSLVDDVVASDPEWLKLTAITGMTEPWGDVRDKWKLATDEFKVRLLHGAGAWGGE